MHVAATMHCNVAFTSNEFNRFYLILMGIIQFYFQKYDTYILLLQ